MEEEEERIGLLEDEEKDAVMMIAFLSHRDNR